MFATNWIRRALQKKSARQTRRSCSGFPLVAEVCEQRRMLSGFDPATDPNDQISEAPILSLPESGERTINARLNFKADVSMYGLRLDAGETIEVDLDGSKKTYIKLFDASGNRLRASYRGRGLGIGAEDDGAEAYLAYKVPSDGLYYFSVSHGTNRHPDPITGDDNPINPSIPRDNRFQVQLRVMDRVMAMDDGDQISEATMFDWSDGQRTVNRESLYSEELAAAYMVNMYEITGSAGDTIGIDVDGHGDIDTYLRLFDAAGNELREINDRQAPDDGVGLEGPPPNEKDPYLQYRLPADGPYYVGISAATNRGYNPVTGTRDNNNAKPESVGTYDLHLRNFTRSVVDNDANDQFNEAVELMRMPVSGQMRDQAREQFEFTNGADVAIAKIDLIAGEKLRLSTASVGGRTFDPLLRLFNSEGEQLRIANRMANGLVDPQGDAGIHFVARESGTYFIGISDRANGNYNPETGLKDTPMPRDVAGEPVVGQLELVANVDLVPGSTDDFDTIDEATVPEFDIPGYELNEVVLENQLLAASEVRMYRIDGNADDSVTIDVDTTHNQDLRLRLFDANGTQLRNIDDRLAPGEEGETTDPALHFRLPFDGPFYVGISYAGNDRYNAVTGLGDKPDGPGSERAFTISIKNHSKPVVDGDANDQISEAIHLPWETESIFGRSIDGVERVELDGGHDVEVYSVDVIADEQIAISLGKYNEGDVYVPIETTIRLFDSNGVELAKNGLGEEYLNYTPATAGRFFIGLSVPGNDEYNVVNGKRDEFVSQDEPLQFSMSVATFLAAGTFDPIDSIDEAGYIGWVPANGVLRTPANFPGTDESLALKRVSEVHVWEFDTTGGEKLVIDLVLNDRDNIPSPGELEPIEGVDGPLLQLFDYEGNELDRAYGDQPQIVFDVPTDADYYLGVSSTENRNYDPLTGGGDVATNNGIDHGNYSITIENLTDIGAPPQDFENDSLGGATPLPRESEAAWIVEGDLSNVDDADFYSLSLNAVFGTDGREYEDLLVEVVPLDGVTPEVVFYRNDGSIFEPSGSEDLDNFEGLKYQGDTGLKFFIVGHELRMELFAPDDADFDEPARYEVRAITTDTSGFADTFFDADATVDDFNNDVGLIANGLSATVTDWISSSTDVDVITFGSPDGEVIEIDIDSDDGADLHVIVFNLDSGEEVAISDNTAADDETLGLDPFVRFTVPEPGDYGIAISLATNLDFDVDQANRPKGTRDFTPVRTFTPYTVSIAAQSDHTLPDDDPNDQVSEAATLVPNFTELGGWNSETGTITSLTDVSMYRLPVGANQRVDLEFYKPESDLDATLILRIFEYSDGELREIEDLEVFEEFNDTELVHYTTEATVLYLGVSAGNNWAYDPLTGGDDFVYDGQAGDFEISWKTEIL